MKKKLAIFLCTAALVFSVAGNVWATPCVGLGGIFDCTSYSSLYSNCQNGDKIDKVSDFNDYNLGTGYFGFNNWKYLSKIDLGGSIDDPAGIDLEVTPNFSAPTGKFEFKPNTWLLYDNIAIVLKGGSQIIPDVKWSAYLLNTGVYEGCWVYDGSKDLSHLSVYGTPVPEPATLLLLGSGLIGLAGIGRRKIRKVIG